MSSRKRKSSYTKPKLRERLKNRILQGSLGGRSGQWSARKAQLLAAAYKKNGGGYRGGKSKTQRSLSNWTKEKWRTSDGKPAIRDGGTTRYLPEKAWSKLTDAQKRATNAKKKKGSKLGRQFVANTEAAADARRSSVKSHFSGQDAEYRVMTVFEDIRIKNDKKLQEAMSVSKMIGCSGVHKDKDGNWMPCASMEELEKISNLAEGPKWRTVVPESGDSKKRTKGRRRKPAADGWEKLNEEPIGGIVSLEGGGLVSGNLFSGKQSKPKMNPCWDGYVMQGMKKGKNGRMVPNCVPVETKSSPGPEYVRENDNDVFIDPESARARSRQLGCIGISRRLSKGGRVVWMPCTNMTDYANRTGSTSLGRRNIQRRDKERMESAVRTVMAKKKPKVSLSQRLNKKK
jgi:hypothetical protein